MVGQNLLRDHHLESLDAVTLVNSSLVKRSIYAKSLGGFGRPGFTGYGKTKIFVIPRCAAHRGISLFLRLNQQ